MNRQHELERARNIEIHYRSRRGTFEASFQLIGAVERLLEKARMQTSDGRVMGPIQFDGLRRELDGVSRAIERVDPLDLQDFTLLEGLLVAQNIGATMAGLLEGVREQVIQGIREGERQGSAAKQVAAQMVQAMYEESIVQLTGRLESIRALIEHERF